VRTKSRLVAIFLGGAVSLALLSVETGGAAADKHSERPYPISPTLSPGLQAFLRLETNPNVFNINYSYGTYTPASDGAYLQNVGSSPSSWYIEDQRYGDTDVVSGVLHDDIGLVKTGLEMFDYGLHREAPNGSFPRSRGLFHGTAMFLAQAGPAMLVLQNWYREPRLGAEMLSRISWEIGRMRTAAHYLVNAWRKRPGHIDDGGKEERKFEGTLAVESVPILADDNWLQHRSGAYAREATTMTEPDGVWTEHGVSRLCCHDSSYQAIGMGYAVNYLTLISPGSSIYQPVNHALQLGETWEFSRTRPNGAVDRGGDDRTGPTCPEPSGSGKCKTLDLVAVMSALMRWGVLTNSNSFIRRAYFVALRNSQQTTGRKLPKPSLFVWPHTTMSVKQIGWHESFFVGGTRYQPLEPVNIYFGKTLVGTVTTDQGGSFGGHSPVGGVGFVPPSSTTAGTYTVAGRGVYATVRRCQVTITG
jgi:hypothetical protein